MGWNNLNDLFNTDSTKQIDNNIFDSDFIVKAIKSEFPFMDIFLVEHAVRKCSVHLKEGGSHSEFIKCLKSKLDGFE